MENSQHANTEKAGVVTLLCCRMESGEKEEVGNQLWVKKMLQNGNINRKQTCGYLGLAVGWGERSHYQIRNLMNCIISYAKVRKTKTGQYVSQNHDFPRNL